MNKKFSTLLVSMLLSGGLFSANAQVQKWPKDVADNGFYHVLKVHASDNTVPYSSSYSISLEEDVLVQETDFTAVTKSNAWTVSAVTVNGKTIGFEFTNANGSKLQFDANGDYTPKASDAVYSVFKFDNKVLKAVNGQGSFIAGKFVEQVGSGYKLSANGTSTLMYTLPIYEQSATELNAQLEDGFAITIGKTKGDANNNPAKLIWDGAYDELEGNVFTGKLTAEAQADGSVMLKNEASKYIVLTKDKWGNLSNSLQGIQLSGYKFTTMTSAQIAASNKILATTFRFTQPNAITAEPLEIKAIESSSNEYELMVAGVNGTYYLTTGDASDALNDDSQRVGAASFTNNWTSGNGTTENTYVKFGDDNYVDYAIFNDAIWNIAQTELNADGKTVETLVAGPSCDPSSAWVPAAQVALAYPEGQWLWNGETFVNRESGRDQFLRGLRKVEGKDNVFTKGRFVYTFTKVGEPGNTELGYLNAYSNDALLQKAFYIGTPVKATNDTVYLAKDEDGALYLSAEKDEAIAFRLERRTFWNDTHTETSQLVKHYTTYASSKTTTGYGKDALNLSQYYVTDASTGDWLSYDNTNKKFILSDTYGYFSLVFKNKDLNTYNIVQFLFTEDEYDNNGNYLNEKYEGSEFCSASKLYGAHNTAELKAADAAYEYVANDLFVLEEVAAGQHISDIEGETIKLYRDSDKNYMLYEKQDGFLGLENFLDPTFAGENASFYVDSAAGKGSWRQEYLLAVDVVDYEDGYMCPFNPLHNDQTWRDEHNNGKPCADAVKVKDFKTGRYLVNLVDSAKAQSEAGVKDAKNEFMFQNYLSSQPYYKLGFVAATHVEDSLIIASTNDTIIVSSNNFADAKVCDFAFHYVGENSFVIETAYDYKTWIDELTEENKYKATKGWIKYHNGLPVVTPVRTEAEVFTLEANDDATANEDVAVSEVKVIAGEGNVAIVGAAGKKVVVSNILGQVVANTVISSDNATIAAPAGVVIVAVEGEAAVKAIVK